MTNFPIPWTNEVVFVFSGGMDTQTMSISVTSAPVLRNDPGQMQVDAWFLFLGMMLGMAAFGFKGMIASVRQLFGGGGKHG